MVPAIRGLRHLSPHILALEKLIRIADEAWVTNKTDAKCFL